MTGAAAGLRERLDALAAPVPGLASCAYLDPGAGTVLGTGSAAGLPQETLDMLCRAARHLTGGETAGDQALIATRRELTVLQRLPGDDGTALALVFAPETRPTAARAAARGLAPAAAATLPA